MKSNSECTWKASELETLYSHPCSANKMIELKNQFSEVIRSNRTLDRINDIRSLIKTLEKRDELNDVRLGEIVQISGFAYAQSTRPRSFENNITARVREVPHDSKTRNEQLTRVYEVISKRLGKHWYDFARALNMTENEIDILHRKQHHKDIVMEVLDYHEKNCDPARWRQMLLNALDEARRKDLRIDIAELLDRFEIINFKTCYL